MCGIIGYVGKKKSVQLLLDGLQKLEYRGYDSAGVALLDEKGELQIRRTEGKLSRLVEEVRNHPCDGSLGIGHTRWATHGKPSETNAHPHHCQSAVARRFESHALLRIPAPDHPPWRVLYRG